MIPIVALVVALACVAASARRIWLAGNPTAFHPGVVVAALEKKTITREAFRALVASDPRAEWERDLLDAIDAPTEHARTALVNEQLTELDWRVNEWVRVPRVCASLATSSGLLLATFVLRQGLGDPNALSGDVGELVTHGLVGDALTVALMGIVGTSFCIAAQGHAKRLAAARLAAVDRLVELLERGGERAAEILEAR